jgi:hypothetical protein
MPVGGLRKRAFIPSIILPFVARFTQRRKPIKSNILSRFGGPINYRKDGRPAAEFFDKTFFRGRDKSLRSTL